MAVLLAALPVRLERDGFLLKLSADSAIAKNGNAGGNNGNAGGNNGKGGKSEAAGKGGGQGGKGKNSGASKGQPNKAVSSASRAFKRKSRGNVELVYPEGFREEIRNGRYVMRDAQGRTIVTRRATERDRARLGQ